MKILVIGSGGREHAICWKIKSFSQDYKIFAIPGNGGISFIGECIRKDISDFNGILEFFEKENINIAIVGPENPLAEGIVDFFVEKKCKIFGPNKKGAKIESSKCFAKEFMKKYKIPTADFQIAESFDEGIKMIEKRKTPYVIKYDGLAAGKGVRIIENFEDGKKYLEEIFIKRIFKGEPKIVIENCLFGKELSYLIFTDTQTYIPMVPAKDYKRVFDGDLGPNTGGMGCYSPPFYFDERLEEEIKKKIVEPTLKGLQKENIDYRGVLYFGLMITKEGPFVLEYNVRFGDPETQVILPRMEGDLVEVIESIIEGSLNKIKIKWKEEKSLCVILASKGYPGEYEKGKEIKNIDKVKDVILFHAGTKIENGKILTDGGRVIGVTGIDKDMRKLRKKVYKAVETIEFEGKHYRKDIGIEE
ncbi:MAG: phosphoribosylamine--glycine ligase [Candidatus Omnitrophica bacterium]|nr:phosphoribosylamine--glycine ligase [Candidatus Omnitrophota bacterium]MCM8806848.1 phosphoribosylamine--glycine ligase [Candidatus Omnitrophota bacterium]